MAARDLTFGIVSGAILVNESKKVWMRVIY